MLEVIINFVISVYYTDKQTRFFLSSNKDFFVCPQIRINGDALTMDNYLNNFIQKYTNEQFAIHHRLLSIKKEYNTITINYSTMLPIDTKVNDIDLISYNVAIIDPLVRKAINYV